jgi:L-ribulose-5-phosphate 4-epimerase
MFTPTAEKLIPDLTPREELVVLARALWREGYNDHLAGHITVNLGDGTLLCNPWLLTWAELRPSQVLRIDLDGRVVEGDWPVPLGIPLHLELHKTREDVGWAVHNHPLFGTVWADLGELPPILDQSSALGGGTLVVVDEYEGPVNDATSAQSAVQKMGDASMALLAGHGVFVLGGSARAVHQRAVALEQRCQRAAPVSRSRSSTWWPGATARDSSASGRRPCAPSWRPTPNCSTDYDGDVPPKTSCNSIGTGVSNWS